MKYIKKYWIAIAIIFLISMFVKPDFCFLIIGSISSYLGITAVVFIKKLKRVGVECIGKILSFESDADGDISPIVEFTLIEGNCIRGKSYVSTSINVMDLSFNERMINDEILILYDPDDPEKFIIRDDNYLNYFGFLFFIIVGLLFVGAGICSLTGYIKID